MVSENKFVIVGKANGKTKYITITDYDYPSLNNPVWTEHFESAKILSLKTARDIIDDEEFKECDECSITKKKLPPLMISMLCDLHRDNLTEVDYEIYIAKIELQRCVYSLSGKAIKPVE